MSAGLERFVTAQARVWDHVETELAEGAKRTHWMWFIFPQIAGLGRSETARHFALAGRAEARDYLAHPLLGARLRRATALMLRHADEPPERILGGIDAVKFRSSMTLFAAVDPSEPLFAEALTVFYAGDPDRRTLELLADNE
jgi:uncharacterized protein (DUF1810 family)